MDETGEMIDVGQSATPQVFDVDNDGLNDLLVGSLNGSIAYYRNTGTNQTAAFTWVTDSLGQAVASSLLGIQGKSVPCMFRDDTGTHLLLGTEPGNIMNFGNIDGNLNGSFALVTDDYNNIREGARTAPAMGDLNGDQISDLIIGNTGGGLAYWQHVPTGVLVNDVSHGIQVYPNPSKGRIIVELPSDLLLPATWQLRDMQGRLVKQGQVATFKTELNAGQAESGCYLLSIESANARTVRHIVIQR
jgi:hypothetical protein